jgi:hypothetical protein
MGFSPHQKRRVGPADFAMLVAATVVAVGLVVWAFVS